MTEQAKPDTTTTPNPPAAEPSTQPSTKPNTPTPQDKPSPRRGQGDRKRREPREPREPRETLHTDTLKSQSTSELFELANTLKIDHVARAKRPDVLASIMRAYAKSGKDLIGSGVLEIMPDNYGFLRSELTSFLPGPDDFYVAPGTIRRFNLRTGDSIQGRLRPPKDGERYFALAHCESINGDRPEVGKRQVDFENLTPLFPNERLRLERGNGSTADITSRVIDLVSPIGKGQRGLIVAPPKVGKTMMLQNVAHAITSNHPEARLIVLLIGERPEEVTEMQRSVHGDVVASTFDESAARHVQVADMVIAKAKRMVEHGEDVVILLDSITRLARAHNTVTPSSGKVLTGGVDANALQRPKRFFGAARNIEHGGSLTIVATALVDTGSKMDEVIYEEFKGTGNMEIHLSRNIAQMCIFPAINIRQSGTRRFEFITSEEEHKRLGILRKYLQTMEDPAAIEFLIERLKSTKTNEEFFHLMRGN